jgi:hypothetical protein
MSPCDPCSDLYHNDQCINNQPAVAPEWRHRGTFETALPRGTSISRQTWKTGAAHVCASGAFGSISVLHKTHFPTCPPIPEWRLRHGGPQPPRWAAPAPLWKPYTSCAGFWMRCSNNQPVYGGSERRESSRHWQRQRRRVRSAEDAGGQAKRIVQQGGISSGWHHCSSSDPAPHAHLWQSRAGPGRELGRRQRHWQQHTAGGCGSTPTSTSSSPAAGTRGS